MKRFFLISLMTLCTCVMAWAVEVSTYSDLTTQLNAGSGQTITITADPLVVADVSSIDLKGNTVIGNIQSNYDFGPITIKNGTFIGELSGATAYNIFKFEDGTNGLSGTITLKSGNTSYINQVSGTNVDAHFIVEEGKGLRINTNKKCAGEITLKANSKLDIQSSAVDAVKDVTVAGDGVTIQGTSAQATYTSLNLTVNDGVAAPLQIWQNQAHVGSVAALNQARTLSSNILLTADIDATGTTFAVIGATNRTIDLGGHTLYANLQLTTSVLKIKNGAFSGTLSKTSGTSYTLYSNVSGSIVSNGVNVNVLPNPSNEAGDYTTSANITVKDANLTFGDWSNNKFVKSTGTIVMERESYSGSQYAPNPMFMVGCAEVDGVTLRGGVISVRSLNNSRNELDAITIEEGAALGEYGTYTTLVMLGIVPASLRDYVQTPDDKCVEDMPGNMINVQVSSACGVAQRVSDGQKFDDLMAAYNDESTLAGDELILKGDVTLSGTLSLEKGITISGNKTITISAGADITFDAEAMNITAPLAITNDADVTFLAGTYSNVTYTNGDVTINGATVKSPEKVIVAAGKEFKLLDGTFEDNGAELQYIRVDGTMRVQGGTLTTGFISAGNNSSKLYVSDGTLNLGSHDNKTNGYAWGGIVAKAYNENYGYDVLSITGGTINYHNLQNASAEQITGYTGHNDDAAIRIDHTIGTLTISNVNINADATGIAFMSGFGASTVFNFSNINVTSTAGIGLYLAAGHLTLQDIVVSAKKPAVYLPNDHVCEYVHITNGVYETTTEGSPTSSQCLSVATIVDAKKVSTSNFTSPLFIPMTSQAVFNKRPESLTPSGKTAYWENHTNSYFEGMYQILDGQYAGWYSAGDPNNVIADLDGGAVFDVARIIAAFPMTEGIHTLSLRKSFTLNITEPLLIDDNATFTITLKGGYALTIAGVENAFVVDGQLNTQVQTGTGSIVAQTANLFLVNEGGKLNLDKGTYQTSEAAYNEQPTYVVKNNGGKINLTGNGTITAAAHAVVNADGDAIIRAANALNPFTVNSTSADKYAVVNSDNLVMSYAKIDGAFGAVYSDAENGNVTIEDSELNGTSDGALFVASNSMVTVRNTQLKSSNANHAAYVGGINGKYGVINIYAKKTSKTYLSDKMFVTDAGGADIQFPGSFSEKSKWYSAANRAEGFEDGYGPLPGGYAYEEVTSGSYYDKGYRWKVIVSNENATESTKNRVLNATEPWQLTTTWEGSDVPTENTIVTIPFNTNVQVKNYENNNAAYAEQIFIADGAELKVESGATLTVGDGGVNIANGGQLVVEPGAVVKLGAAGLITTDNDAVVIEYNGTNSGVFMIDPAVTENTQPKATVKMYSKAYRVADNNFRWQHFAIPTVSAPDSFKMPVTTAVYYLDYNDDITPWKTIGAVANMNTPFQGYNLTNWANAPGTEYTFYGNIIGNGDGKMPFVGTGYNFCGNSYTAPIDIERMLLDIKNNSSVDVEPTVNIYDTENDQYRAITKSALDAAGWMGTPVVKQIAPMQGFFLNLRSNTSGDIEVIDYSNSVWGNPSISTGASLAPQRFAADNSKGINMIVSANDRQDNVLMIEKADYSVAFDDNADAFKMMSEHSFNLWANIDSEAQAIVASNTLENTILGFQSVEGGEYTITFKTNNMDGEYILLDIATGAQTAIVDGIQYTFTQEANVSNAARFEIVKEAKMPTAIENVEEAAKATGIFTVTGQFVGRDYNDLPKGVYVINGQKIIK